ncbi:MAG: DEAD/DEAH box helicase [Desulfobacteraceae bacterium]|nr:DEAD/DEAH box helicase [Desulfobacteraceae bacterium]MBC2757956.1 DEAD/DEAH box helicase [Desulfobacteraceae bacterium]
MVDYKKRKYHRRPTPHKKKAPAHRLTPGSDAKLKRVFAEIGVPETKPFTPDPFQIRSLEAIQQGDCLVTVPTGAGKTWIAEQAITHTFKNNGKAWYASPLKALTNSKFAEFSKIFGPENVGILTGDRKENMDAPIIIGTTEILRNQLYDAMHRGEDLDTDFIILDEAHFLGDEERGVVWEETMIYLPRRIPLLLLSATIGNAHQIAAWLKSIRGNECIVIKETNRPVPLYPLFLHPSGTLFPFLAENQAPQTKKRLYKKVLKFVNARHTNGMMRSNRLPPMGDILRILRKYRLLPSIFFLKSRADCDHALVLSAMGTAEESPNRKELRHCRIEELIAASPHVAGHKQMHYLKEFAVGAHHSGQLPIWKLIIETLMTEGLLNAVFATSTVAAGVNFPARTILFLNSDRFNGREFLPLTATEFHQMTGRAGRRGMDNIGFGVVIPGRFMDIRKVENLFNAPPSGVYSQIKINFSMVLNLLLSHTPEQVKKLLDKSFAAYLMANKDKKTQKENLNGINADILWQHFLDHLDFLKKKEYVTIDNKLTDDGEWTSQLRIDHPLMVAEGFRKNLFPKSNPAFLAAIMAAFVNERETDDDAIDTSMIPKTLFKIFKKIDTGLKPFSKEMYLSGFESPTLYFLPAVTLYLWARGMPWEDVVLISKMAEGNLAMLILRTADNLRHIRNIGRVFPDAAEASGRAIDLILRDPVISTYEA